MAQHSIEDDHRIDWKESVVIDRDMNLYKTRVKEALYIWKFPNFNQDQGLIVSPIWNGVRYTLTTLEFQHSLSLFHFSFFLSI